MASSSPVGSGGKGDDAGDPEPKTLVEKVSEWCFYYCLDDVALGYTYDVHRAVATGLWNAAEGTPEDEEEHRLVDDPDLDVFGQPRGHKKTLECVCPQCNRTLQAFRFAPHLEKCMGMGRSSSRIASQRIAKSNKDSGNNDDDDGDQDDDDDDWDFRSEAVKRTTKKPKKVRKPPSIASSRAGDEDDAVDEKDVLDKLDEEEEDGDDGDDSNDEDYVVDDDASRDSFHDLSNFKPAESPASGPNPSPLSFSNAFSSQNNNSSQKSSGWNSKAKQANSSESGSAKKSKQSKSKTRKRKNDGLTRISKLPTITPMVVSSMSALTVNVENIDHVRKKAETEAIVRLEEIQKLTNISINNKESEAEPTSSVDSNSTKNSQEPSGTTSAPGTVGAPTPPPLSSTAVPGPPGGKSLTKSYSSSSLVEKVKKDEDRSKSSSKSSKGGAGVNSNSNSNSSGKQTGSQPSSNSSSPQAKSLGKTYQSAQVEDIMHFEGLTKDERKTLLKQICGSIVEYGHKLCIATKCNIHSDEERKVARWKLSTYKSMAALQAAELNPSASVVHLAKSDSFGSKKKSKDKDKHKKRDGQHRH